MDMIESSEDNVKLSPQRAAADREDGRGAHGTHWIQQRISRSRRSPLTATLCSSDNFVPRAREDSVRLWDRRVEAYGAHAA